MTIMHHPGDETLAAFAAGTLDEAHAVVVATHVGLCGRCQKAMRAFEQVGGALLEAAAPTRMSPGALERAMSKLDIMSKLDNAPKLDSAALDRPLPPVMPVEQIKPAEDMLPPPLNLYPLGRWRRIGGGLQTRAVRVPSAADVRVFLLKGGPGTRLPQHRHTGTEWTCVVHGAYHDEHHRYGPGDFDEVDESIEHYQVVEDGPTCIAVVAMQGKIRLQGWLGRLLQPFVRI